MLIYARVVLKKKARAEGCIYPGNFILFSPHKDTKMFQIQIRKASYNKQCDKYNFV